MHLSEPIQIHILINLHISTADNVSDTLHSSGTELALDDPYSGKKVLKGSRHKLMYVNVKMKQLSPRLSSAVDVSGTLCTLARET